MMPVRWMFAALAALSLFAPGAPGVAQTVAAKAVSACGTPGNTPVAGNSYPVTQDLTGVLCTASLGGATADKQPALGTAAAPSTDVITVGGPVAGAGTAAGAPLPIGCDHRSTLPTYTDGQRVQWQCGTRGAGAVTIFGPNSTTAAAVNTSIGDSSSNTSSNLATNSRGVVFNGSTWDRARGDVVGAAVQPYGIRSARWSYAAAAGGIVNTTTAVTIKAADAAATKNCLVSLEIVAEALGAATEIVIRDGAAGAVLWRSKIGIAGWPSGRTIAFGAPVCGSDATLMEAATLTASVTGAVYLNATGYVGP